MLAATPPRPCRHCSTTADRCRAHHDWTDRPCCADCLHDWEGHPDAA
jgi:hypothetical protein